MIKSQLLIILIIFFTFVAEIVHAKNKFSNQLFRNFLSSEDNYSFIIASTNIEEIYKIISSLNTNKSFGHNSISTKVLHLLQYQTPNYLATICNLPLSTGIFPAILKLFLFKRGILNQNCLTIDPFLSYPILIKLQSRADFLEEKQILYYR